MESIREKKSSFALGSGLDIRHFRESLGIRRSGFLLEVGFIKVISLLLHFRFSDDYSD